MPDWICDPLLRGGAATSSGQTRLIAKRSCSSPGAHSGGRNEGGRKTVEGRSGRPHRIWNLLSLRGVGFAGCSCRTQPPTPDWGVPRARDDSDRAPVVGGHGVGGCFFSCPAACPQVEIRRE